MLCIYYSREFSEMILMRFLPVLVHMSSYSGYKDTKKPAQNVSITVINDYADLLR